MANYNKFSVTRNCSSFCVKNVKMSLYIGHDAKEIMLMSAVNNYFLLGLYFSSTSLKLFLLKKERGRQDV